MNKFTKAVREIVAWATKNNRKPAARRALSIEIEGSALVMVTLRMRTFGQMVDRWCEESLILGHHDLSHWRPLVARRLWRMRNILKRQIEKDVR